MFNQYEPVVKVVIQYLRLLKVQVTNTTINETLQNHPDWPSLLCVSDSLNLWHIPNAAGKIDTSKIDELPLPFMAYIKNQEYPLSIVTKVSDNQIEVVSKDYRKKEIFSREDFAKTWNGVFLLAEPDEHSGESNYRVSKRKEFINFLLPSAALVLPVFIGSYIFIRNLDWANSLSVNIFIQYFISLLGVMVTSLLLWYEIDKSNPLLQKVCTGIIKGNCNAILTGRQARLFSWLSWSEVGFFYFSGTFLALLFSGEKQFALAGLLNILALPYTVFSVYYQWKVAKQWCVLCLAVQALLLFGAINILVSGFSIAILPFTVVTLLKFILPFICLMFFWYSLKPYILSLQTAKNNKREYLRIKFNAEIFEMLLKKQKKISLSVDDLGIDIGNATAKNTIIKVCNPYCGPCAKAHPKIEELLEQNKDVKAKIIFTATNNEANPALKPARHLLAIAEKNNEKKIKQALDDWYLPETKNYEVFKNKYPMNGELLKQSSKIEAMDKWCKETGITFTPTIFVNGNQLPKEYTIEDLQYFLLE